MNIHRSLRNKLQARKVLLPSVLSVGISLPALAANVTKSATGTDLFDGASWGGTAPTAADIAVWQSTSLGSALTLGSNASWGGIRVNGALSDIGITGTGNLTLGQGGINTAGSGVNFSIANAITLGSMGSWWTADTGKSITASGAISGAGTLNLGSRGIAVNTYLTSTATTIATNTSLSSITSVSGLMNGGSIGYSAGSDAYKFTNDGTTATYQLRILDGGYTKSVGIELKQSGSDITGRVLYAKYLSGSNLTTDFDTAGTTGTIATSDSGTGYGSRLASLVYTPAANEQGTITLSGNNTFTGGVAIHAGTVKIGNANAFGQTSTRTNVGTVIVGSGATVNFNGVADAQYGYTISGTGVGGAGALINTGAAIGSTLRQASNIALNADASIGGTSEWSLLANAYAATNLYLNGHTLTKTGANTIGLVNTTLNAGTVQVSQGTLTLGIASSGINGAAAAFVMDNTSGAILNVNQNSSIGSLAGGGTTGGNMSISSSRTLTVGALNTNTTYAGVISGAGALAKTGSGTLTLSGANTFTGGITVNNGIVVFNASGLAFNSATGAGGGTLTVNAGATARFAGNFNTGYSRPITVNGGTLNLTAGTANDSNNYSNNLTLNSGAAVTGNRLRVGYHSNATITVGGSSASTISSGLALLNNNKSLTLNVGDASSNSAVDLTVSGVISDVAGFTGLPLIKSGAGTASFTNANTYIGTTTVNAGTLLANNTTGSATGTGAVTVASGATLGGTGSISGTLSVTGSVAPGNSIGTLKAGTTTWNGAASAGAATDWKFELGDTNTSDKLEITGNFLKDTTNGSVFNFDFMGSDFSGLFTLVTWTGTTDFTSAGEFSYSNLGGGRTGSFTLNANSLQFTAVPEPSSLLVGGLLGLGLLRRRRIVA